MEHIAHENQARGPDPLAFCSLVAASVDDDLRGQVVEEVADPMVGCLTLCAKLLQKSWVCDRSVHVSSPYSISLSFAENALPKSKNRRGGRSRIHGCYVLWSFNFRLEEATIAIPAHIMPGGLAHWLLGKGALVTRVSIAQCNYP